MASTEGGSIVTRRSTTAPAADDDRLLFDTPMTSLWTVLYELGGCTALGLELMYQASELAERCEKMNASNPFFPNLAQDVHAFFKVLRILELPSRQRATVLGKSSTYTCCMSKKNETLTFCCFVVFFKELAKRHTDCATYTGYWEEELFLLQSTTLKLPSELRAKIEGITPLLIAVADRPRLPLPLRKNAFINQ